VNHRLLRALINAGGCGSSSAAVDWSSPTVQQTSFYLRSGTIGTFMDLEGVVQYADQAERRFTATLRGSNDDWRIVSFRFSDGID
jgi:hypothetical protein